MENEKKFPVYLDHLNKTFLEELSYKIWSTKGARFHASKRLLIKNNLSNQAIGFLSAYLIIFGLLSVYQISKVIVVDSQLIAFGSTTISILLLAFSQMESAQDFKMRAHRLHDCALKISNLYNEIRIFKTFNTHSEKDKNDFCQRVSNEYQNILANYDNHDDIDFKIFKADHRKYYELKWRQVLFIKLHYFLKTQCLYLSLIVVPPLVLITIHFLP